MNARNRIVRIVAAAVAAIALPAAAQTSVQYGRITNVTLMQQANTGAQAGGALLGGVLGAATGPSGQSGGNRALRGVGGAAAGRQLGRLASNRPTFEYTILVGRQTVTMITDEAGLRVGDCVAVERGAFNNLRLVDDSRCAPNVRPTQAAVNEASACDRAKEELLAAETDEAFDRAERRVRLLCRD